MPRDRREFGMAAMSLLSALALGGPLPMAVSTGEFARPERPTPKPDNYHHNVAPGPNRKARRKAKKGKRNR